MSDADTVLDLTRLLSTCGSMCNGISVPTCGMNGTLTVPPHYPSFAASLYVHTDTFEMS